MRLKFLHSFLITMILSASSAFAQSSAYEVGTWKGFRSSAATFTFDDGCANQLSLAVPIFDKYKYPASFYLVTGWQPNWSSYSALVSKGYEIGSHSDNHEQTMGNSEIASSKATIDKNITNQVCNTITYPNCNEPSESELAKYYIGGRTCDGQVQGKTPSNYFRIGSVICGTTGSCNSASAFQSQMQTAIGKNGWVVFLIHEVESGSGYSPTATSAIEGALSFASKNDSKVWVCTFRDAILYSKERNAANISELSNTATEITMKISDNLADDTYKYPLSLRRALPEGWTDVKVSQGDNEMESSVSGNYIYFEAVPDGGIVTLSSGSAAVSDPKFTISDPKGTQSWCSDSTYSISWTMEGEATSSYTLNWNSASASSSDVVNVSSASASSEWTNDENTFSWSVDNILTDDGEHGKSNRWGAQGNSDEWVMLSLANTNTVAGVIIDEFEEYGTVSGFRIEYDANGTWKTAYEGSTIGANFKATFTPVSTSKIRLFITASSGININYFTATGVSMSNIELKNNITGNGSYTWNIPSGLTGSGTITINKASGKALASSPAITIKSCGKDPIDPVNPNDPCSEEHSLPTSGGQKITANGVQNFGSRGYNLELWGADGGSMTVYPDADCAFKADWNNPGDFLARVGYYWNGQKGSYKDLEGDIHADFNFSFTGSGGTYNYIGIYGWTKTPKEMEYYIVENTFFKNTTKQQGLYYNANSKGTYTLDGDTYTLYVGTRTNAPSISGTSTFPQIFAVRKTARYCGHISVSDHFREWEKLNVDMGGSIYDCKLLCEAGGGQGTFEMKYGKMWIGSSVETDETTIDEVNGITIAPNPTKGNFSIFCDKEIVKVELINTVGQILLSQESTENINISVASGIYFVKAYVIDGSTYIEKLQVK